MNYELNLLWRMFCIGINKKKITKNLLKIEPPTQYFYKIPQDKREKEFVLISKRGLEYMNDTYDKDKYPNDVLVYDSRFLMFLLQTYTDSLSKDNFNYEDDCFLIKEANEICNLLNSKGFLVEYNDEIDLEDFGIYEEDDDEWED